MLFRSLTVVEGSEGGCGLPDWLDGLRSRSRELAEVWRHFINLINYEFIKINLVAAARQYTHPGRRRALQRGWRH